MFSFPPCRLHRDLPSFPTRRSSDLPRALSRPPNRRFHCQRHPAGPPRHHRSAPPARSRSEEHTSELQSRQYLVCRLLLEKKKIATSLIVENGTPVYASARSCVVVLT